MNCFIWFSFALMTDCFDLNLVGALLLRHDPDWLTYSQRRCHGSA
jgi:hypothetical protein